MADSWILKNGLQARQGIELVRGTQGAVARLVNVFADKDGYRISEEGKHTEYAHERMAHNFNWQLMSDKSGFRLTQEEADALVDAYRVYDPLMLHNLNPSKPASTVYLSAHAHILSSDVYAMFPLYTALLKRRQGKVLMKAEVSRRFGI